ncbi:MAG: hypothetical protein IPM31_18485 [Anaerolineae bacterium]|nr:hypothetical protein [Anaerolineae bacterium]MBL8106031.1 hypothetical protein [Anaerolineales bacterium]MCC7190222.1 hypothetical protein [Anaerolineales bacterium]
MNIHDPIINISQDKLNAQSLAKIILHRLTDNDCPSTIGLYGSWGTGKTSTLNIMADLNRLAQTNKDHELINKPSEKVVIKDKMSLLVRGSTEKELVLEMPKNTETMTTSKSLHIEIIDAWQYDSTNNLLTPVIVRLLKYLRRLDETRFFDWKKYAERVIEVTSLALSDMALRKLTGLTLGDVKDYEEKIEKKITISDWEQTIDHIEETNRAFTELVRIFLTYNKQDKLILCIDNLDRCSPENVVQLLESIKNYLSVRNCIWVFVMDNNLISSYINRKYEGTNMDGNSYLDKIIPEQYHVIQPTYEQATELLHGILIKGIKLGNFARINRFLVPRRIKTAVKYEQTIKLLSARSEGSKDTLFALILLYHGWPDFYEFLSSGFDDHIISTLNNFYSKIGEIKKVYQKIPVPEIYDNDKELIYYIQSAFYQNPRGSFLSKDTLLEAHFATILECIRVLRFVGLP